MLKKTVLIIFIFGIMICAQNGPVKSYYPDGKIQSEINYVNKIREGSAKFYYENGNLRQEFSYINGKVEGLVKEYYESGKLKMTYNIENGKKEGRVSIFKEDGTFLTDMPYAGGKRVIENFPIVEESPDTSIKKSGNPKEENSDYIPPVLAEDTIKADSIYTTAEVMPEPVGGMEGIYKRIVYPQQAKDNKIEGTVKIQAVINQSGDVTDAKIVNDIGYDCGESAKITIFYTRFKPGLQKGKPVMTRITIPIEFKLPKEGKK
ncbi:MAG: TonB family protein [Ignavibacteriaceae bacterium]|nr:TonB family protein [Ignavibacteriaceae bacterium]